MSGNAHIFYKQYVSVQYSENKILHIRKHLNILLHLNCHFYNDKNSDSSQLEINSECVLYQFNA